MVQRGCSYAKRVKEVNEIYDKYARMGLSNRATGADISGRSTAFPRKHFIITSMLPLKHG